ncbi:Trafficking protein particle complex subunit 3 [Porphyridium purpureum]|uniref:Trafficking protein particle complex subunit n=1 Tax=Porphyridium purpureum TaxID=35688 RepID=A0A5J4YRW7_PORPP|nr:Trafficking protein particle complex subunit 3 [Porphyridium purpureum]|eukprot:POR0485..scf229_5
MAVAGLKGKRQRVKEAAGALSMSKGGNMQKLGELALQKGERVPVELLALTYGSLVRQVIADYESIEEVNKQLDLMGYNIGVRLADDFFAKSGVSDCRSFQDSAEIVAKVGFKMYLNVQASVDLWNADNTAYSILFDENPLAEFTELPEEYAQLSFSNLVCGVIRGALEMLLLVVKCEFVRSTLQGNEMNEIRISLVEMLRESAPEDDED